MKIDRELADVAVLEELGFRLEQRRIARGLTQADLAREAGVGKRTIERVEAGGSAQSSSLLRILRALDLVDRLEVLLPAASSSPLALAQRRGRSRQRASTRPRETERSTKWTWGDEP